MMSNMICRSTIHHY